MAAPTYKAKGTLDYGSGNSISVGYPTTAANDLMLLFLYNSGSAKVFTPSGWTQLGLLKSTTDGIYIMRCYYKLATGSETGSLTCTRNPLTVGLFAGQIYSYDGTNNIAILGHSTATGTTNSITWNSVTMSGTERTLAAFIMNKNDSAGVPSGYTNNASDSFTDNGEGVEFEINTKENVTSAPSASATSGTSTNNWVTFHIVIYNNDPVVTSPRSFIVN